MNIGHKNSKITDIFENEDSLQVDEILENNEILFAISEVIENYRSKHNLTQKELAKMLNMRQVMISKLESGQYNPTLKMLYKISRKLTNSTELFVEMLEKIKEQLTDMYVVKYDVEIFTGNINSIKKEKNKLVTINYNNNINVNSKGENVYEEDSTSMLSIA